MMNILYAVLVLGVMGAIFGGLLAFAAKIFHVEQDPRIGEVTDALRGANCGGWGTTSRGRVCASALASRGGGLTLAGGGPAGAET